ncbi:hypothetical protein CYY_003986 [Polysphondylium violaceum]|uniref:T-cell immunomodulatory protein TIP C2 domain-containing protein n=1 Tax=Polysphondylium violaceum TaxID=133409 RepID=A0A8J4PVY8_9MYCE|nr:hypothetical protein CYY_003986 [Polysphondylium violaceum]
MSQSTLYSILFIVLVSLCSIEHTKADFFKDFWKPVFTNAPKFSSSQLYQIEDIGFNNYQGSVLAFGDFNADKYLDTFFLYSNQSTLQVFLWNIEDWKYDPSDIIISFSNDTEIFNVVPGDFSYDGFMDILIQYKTISDDKYYMNLYLGYYTSISTTPLTITSDIAPTDHVLVLDSNNDLRLDMFGVNAKGQRTLWVTNEDDTITSRPMFNGDSQTTATNPLSKPHSNSFVDFNGDCLADMFITSISPNGSLVGEIWINQKENGYILTQSLVFPDGTGQITFSDFDGDGDIDMLYPVCWPINNCSQVNSIYLVYNSQKPVCASSLFGNSAKCRPQNQLCMSDDNFLFSSTITDDGTTRIITKENFNSNTFFSNIIQDTVNDNGEEDVNNSGSSSRSSSAAASGSGSGDNVNNLVNNIPLIIHSGDYNIDGYPDLLLSVIRPGDKGPHIELWENVACTESLCGAGRSGRTFVNVTSNVDDLVSIENAYSAVFVDLGENGISDILVWTKTSVQAVFNNFYNDAFFFKTLGLNGVCTTMCPSGKKFPNPKPYGVNFPGAIFKFTYTDLSGTTHIQMGAQLYQSSYMSLQTPYNLFGLGRTSNYVDQLFFGVPLNQTVHYSNWVGTIPNSQVVAIPYKANNPLSWTLELFINPSGIFFWVLIAFFVALIVLSAICFFLYKREKKQDEKMKQEAHHQFYFNAL